MSTILPFDIEAIEAVIGGNPGGRPAPGVNPNQRNVKFDLISTGGTSREALKQRWDGESNVWIIIHGWNDRPNNPNSNLTFAELGQSVGRATGNTDIVLTLDWSEASINTTTFADSFQRNFANVLEGLNGIAATWIASVGAWAAQQLQEWGITDGSKINLIGHSLGTLLSSEIASNFTGGINTLTALEPPSDGNLIFSGGYDVDGRPGIQAPKAYTEVSRFSRAFLGSRSLAGSDRLSSLADESILMDFGDRFDLGEEHGWVIETFKTLIEPTAQGPGLANGLFSLQNGPNTDFASNRFRYTTSSTFNHEGVIAVTAPNQPLSFTAKAQIGSVDDIIYGTNRNDLLTDGYSTSRGLSTSSAIDFGEGNDRIIAGSGNDTLVGSFGNDTLEGGRGGDRFVFGGDVMGASILGFPIKKSLSFSEVGIDTVSDFGNGADRLVLDKTTFTALRTEADTSLRRDEFASINEAVNGAIVAGASTAKIVFNSFNGDLFYNPDGAVAGLNAGGRFAILSGVDFLARGQIVVQA